MAALQLTLQAFLAHHGALPQVWGQVDCCLVLADWAVWLGNDDPAADLRGSYDSEEGCRAVVSAAGGLLPLVAGCAARAGWLEAEEQAIGVVGVIGSPAIVNRQWGAIWDGRHWLVRMADGFVSFTAKPFFVWSCR
ncbi:hypothetical protein OHD62_17290 [Mesorhizobium sp. YC-39]|uniref:DUF6950 family protein n=1 Tax=unclassified Mesorhizobium TaxID=325217 RepID=UPI0021E97F2A|nr:MULTISPECIES: hypothetical protein [unclassified Mesorhizobium]MCV3209598.1 hypothetical protein [Mesorhizobium sp. YC-2]MCV3230128.1 hypothetical protein [Mesorhizobium sp. YC-39]